MQDVSAYVESLYKKGVYQIIRIREIGKTYAQATTDDYAFFTDKDIEQQSFVLNRKAFSGSNVEVGSVVSATVGLTLIRHCNGEKPILGDAVSTIARKARTSGYLIEVGIKDWNNPNEAVQWCSLGKFFFAEAKQVSDGKVTVTFYDRMKQLDKPVDISLNGQSVELSMSGFESILTKCYNVSTTSQLPFEILYEAGSAPYYDPIYMEWTNLTETTTYRQILSTFLRAWGSIGFFDTYGKLITINSMMPRYETVTLTQSELKRSEEKDYVGMVNMVQLLTSDDGIHTGSEYYDGGEVKNVIVNISDYFKYSTRNTLNKNATYETILSTVYGTLNGTPSGAGDVLIFHVGDITSVAIPYMDLFDLMNWLETNEPIHQITYRPNNFTRFASVGQTALPTNTSLRAWQVE